MLNIGLIGYGTAGEAVGEALMAGSIEGCRLAAVLVRSPQNYNLQGAQVRITASCDDFLAQDLDVVVEAAGHGAVQANGEAVLRAGVQLVLSSVGALGEDELYYRLLTAATRGNASIYLPSAAVAGLDRIAAAREDGLETVRLTTRKPVAAWRGTYAESVVNLDKVTEPTQIFSGNARDSARLFPESVNVSAALSLAGVGFEKTEVRVMVDPTIRKNIHEVYADGKFGELQLQVQNTPSPANPKTGYIVAMSMCKVLRQISSPLKVGL